MGSFLLGVFQDSVGNPRGTPGAVFFLHDRQCGRSIDLRNVVIVFQGPVGKRSFEVRLDCHSLVMHILQSLHGKPVFIRNENVWETFLSLSMASPAAQDGKLGRAFGSY